MDAVTNVDDALLRAVNFLNDFSRADLDDIAADGGVTVGMVFQQQAKWEATLLARAGQAHADAGLLAALEPVWNWYQSDEHPERPLVEVIADIVSDLQHDRALALRATALEADAARYRWLRDKSVPPHNFYIGVPDEFHGVKYHASEVDAYIDAAIAAAKGEKA